MPSDDLPLPPREPEIEALGRIARRGLWLARIVLWLGGLASATLGVLRMVAPELGPDIGLAPPNELPGGGHAIAPEFVWFCPALVLLLPVEWTFFRGRWIVLGLSALLWIVPIWLPGDHEYGYVLRVFGTLIAFLTMLVWRTLWGLGGSE